jgi:polyisoprenyl-teichoic acid--peptidoglycan teichoic acid transferase
MDNFKRTKHPTRGSAVDGFVRHPKKPSGGSPQPTRQTIGNFNQAEGFRATGQPNLATAAKKSGMVGTNPAQEIPKVPVVGMPKRQDAKRHDRKKTHKWRRLAKYTSIFLVVLLVVGGGYVGAKAYMKSRNVLKGGGEAPALQADVAPERLKGEGDGRINILLLGRGGDGHEGPDLTDTLIIASIDPVHKEAALVSIPRDFWVKPAAGGPYTKINSVYANAKYAVQNGKKIPNQAAAAEDAGEAAIAKTVESVFGIPIHYHTMVDFEAFRKSIDTVGGVDVNVRTQLYDPTVAWENKWNPVIAAVGLQHMDGKKALLYSRSRNGSARGDFDRAERQREVMIALKEKVFSLGTFSNPVKISQLVDAFGNHVQTNFDTNELLRLYGIVKTIPSTKVTSVGLADPPNNYITTGSAGGQSVVMPRAGIGNYAEIQNYIRNALKDSYLRDENASIIVVNGTGKAGVATAKATELKSYGYNVSQVIDTPSATPITQNVLVDMRSGAKKYTKHYLETRLGVTSTTKLPSGITAGTADFVIVLGKQ